MIRRIANYIDSALATLADVFNASVIDEDALMEAAESDDEDFWPLGEQPDVAVVTLRSVPTSSSRFSHVSADIIDRLNAKIAAFQNEADDLHREIGIHADAMDTLQAENDALMRDNETLRDQLARMSACR